MWPICTLAKTLSNILGFWLMVFHGWTELLICKSLLSSCCCHSLFQSKIARWIFNFYGIFLFLVMTVLSVGQSECGNQKYEFYISGQQICFSCNSDNWTTEEKSKWSFLVKTFFYFFYCRIVKTSASDPLILFSIRRITKNNPIKLYSGICLLILYYSITIHTVCKFDYLCLTGGFCDLNRKSLLCKNHLILIEFIYFLMRINFACTLVMRLVYDPSLNNVTVYVKKQNKKKL